MSLVDKQDKFVEMLGLLLAFARFKGYQVTFGRGSVTEEENKVVGGHPNSLHLRRLALDLNLFKDGKWLTNTEDHKELGEFWEYIGGTWGGRFNDGNHYSLAHKGMK